MYRTLIEAGSEREEEIYNTLKRHKHTRRNEALQYKRSKLITFYKINIAPYCTIYLGSKTNKA